MFKKPVLFYIMGKSASGKDTVYKEVISRMWVKPLVEYTTRPMRTGEVNGEDYNFISDADFNTLEKIGVFCETRSYDTVDGEWKYGTRTDNLEQNEIYVGIGTPDAALELQKDESLDFHACYIEADDFQRLLRSLGREHEQKNPNYREVCRRFIADDDDFSEAKLSLINDLGRIKNDDEEDMEECVDTICTYLYMRMKWRF